MQTAWTLLNVKNVDEEQRVITGIASTPTVDRMGDIVEPMGAVFKTPMPLLLYHSGSKPVGTVTFAKPTKDGIPFVATLPKVIEAGTVKDRVDEAWHSVKYKLIGAVSIGFQALEDGVELLKNGGLRFTKWEWLELSLVAIPAQPEAVIQGFKSMDPQQMLSSIGAEPSDSKERDALIQRIKSADRAALAASGRERKSLVVRLDTPPGASGTQPSISRSTNDMKTIKQQIEAFEAKRAANVARMKSMMEEVGEKGETLDAAASEEYDTLADEVKSIDKHLTRLKEQLELEAATAAPVQRSVVDSPEGGSAAREPRPNSGVISVRSNLEPGVRFARYAQALVRGMGNPQQALACIQADQRWMRETPELAMVMKTAIAAGDTTTSGWASELVYAENLANEFIEYLRPMTILGKIGNFRRVPFNIRVGGMSGGTTGYWVGQGKPIPVSKGTTTSVSLAIAKVAGLTAIDNELARLSTPSAELMIRNDLAKALIYVMDDSFINPNNGGVTNVSPASMTYGVTPVTPTGTTYAAMRTDLQTLMETAFDNSIDTTGSVWIMSQTLALKLAMMVNALDQKVNPELTPEGGRFQGYQAVVSQAAQIAGSPQYNDVLIWLHPQEVFMADDGQVTIEASKEASIELSDAPTNQSTGGTTATSMVSMFQTETMAIKAVRFVNWTKRRTQAAQWISAAAYTG